LILPALRGIASVTAAATGLLLVYNVIYSMEGMTTRVPMNPARELAMTASWMFPLTILYCSGLHDFCNATKQEWIFWMGSMLAVAVLFYFESSTSSDILTKVAAPILAAAAGVLPHVLRRVRFVFTVFCFTASLAGAVVLYFVMISYFSGSSFATKATGFLVFAFGTASLTVGALSLASAIRRNPRAETSG
jgi:hypothetical protein